MQAFLGGQDVTLTIPLTDTSGTELEAVSIDYRVIDQDGLELIARTPLATFNSGDTEAVVAISAGHNNLGELTRGLRVVELYVLTETATSLLTVEYVIEQPSVLVFGHNSFQNYPSAVLLGFELPNVPGWNAASKTERINALMAAYRNFGKLRLRYVYDDDVSMRVITPELWASSDITKLDGPKLLMLPSEYLACLRRAQVLEADFLLGGDQVGDIRRSGIMSTTIGESSSFFRTSKPIEGAVCKRALKELSKYVISGTRAGRA